MGMPSYLADIEERLADDLRRAEADRREWTQAYFGRAPIFVSEPPRPRVKPRWQVMREQQAARDEARRIREAVGNALWFEAVKDVAPLRRGCR